MSDNAASSSGQQAGPNSQEATNNVIRAIGNILKSQTGEQLSNEKISNLLLANMTTLVQQGKLSQSQIIQVDYTVCVFGMCVLIPASMPVIS